MFCFSCCSGKNKQTSIEFESTTKVTGKQIMGNNYEEEQTIGLKSSNIKGVPAYEEITLKQIKIETGELNDETESKMTYIQRVGGKHDGRSAYEQATSQGSYIKRLSDSDDSRGFMGSRSYKQFPDQQSNYTQQLQNLKLNSVAEASKHRMGLSQQFPGTQRDDQSDSFRLYTQRSSERINEPLTEQNSETNQNSQMENEMLKSVQVVQMKNKKDKLISYNEAQSPSQTQLLNLKAINNSRNRYQPFSECDECVEIQTNSKKSVQIMSDNVSQYSEFNKQFKSDQLNILNSPQQQEQFQTQPALQSTTKQQSNHKSRQRKNKLKIFTYNEKEESNLQELNKQQSKAGVDPGAPQIEEKPQRSTEQTISDMQQVSSQLEVIKYDLGETKELEELFDQYMVLFRDLPCDIKNKRYEEYVKMYTDATYKNEQNKFLQSVIALCTNQQNRIMGENALYNYFMQIYNFRKQRDGEDVSISPEFAQQWFNQLNQIDPTNQGISKDDLLCVEEVLTEKIFYEVSVQQAFTKIVNALLANDNDCKHIIPIDPINDSIYSKLGDGIILCKLLLLIDPQCLHYQTINLYSSGMSVQQKRQNLNLALSTSKNLGIQIQTQLRDLIVQDQTKMYKLIKQLIRKYLSSTINIEATPELQGLKFKGEQVRDFQNLTPCAILMRWVNYHLLKSYNIPITNFDADLANSTAMLHLLYSISDQNDASDLKLALRVADKMERAQMMLDKAKSMGITDFIKPIDLQKENYLLNSLYLCQIFRVNHGLQNIHYHKQATKDEETSEEFTLRTWLKSLNLKINNIDQLYSDAKDGILLCKVINQISESPLINLKQINLDPKTEKQRKSNNQLSLNVIKYQLDPDKRIQSIQDLDITQNRNETILEILWHLMRYHYLNSIGTEQDLIKWANELLDNTNYNLPIAGLSDSNLATSAQFITILSKIVDVNKKQYKLQNLTAEQKRSNAQYFISEASRQGCLMFTSVNDILTANSNNMLLILAELNRLANYNQKIENIVAQLNQPNSILKKEDVRQIINSILHIEYDEQLFNKIWNYYENNNKINKDDIKYFIIDYSNNQEIIMKEEKDEEQIKIEIQQEDNPTMIDLSQYDDESFIHGFFYHLSKAVGGLKYVSKSNYQIILYNDMKFQFTKLNEQFNALEDENTCQGNYSIDHNKSQEGGHKIQFKCKDQYQEQTLQIKIQPSDQVNPKIREEIKACLEESKVHNNYCNQQNGTILYNSIILDNKQVLMLHHPILKYRKMRGMMSSIRYQLQQCGVYYILEEYDQDTHYLKVQSETKIDLDDLDGLYLSQIGTNRYFPYFEYHDVTLTDPLEIHKYIAAKWNPNLLRHNQKKQKDMEELGNYIIELQNQLRNAYLQGNKEEYLAIIQNNVQLLITSMKGNIFIIDDQLSWVDFLFFALLEFMYFLTDAQIYSFKNCEKLIPFYTQMMDLPNLGQYLTSPGCIDQEYDFYVPPLREEDVNVNTAQLYVQQLFEKLKIEELYMQIYEVNINSAKQYVEYLFKKLEIEELTQQNYLIKQQNSQYMSPQRPNTPQRLEQKQRKRAQMKIGINAYKDDSDQEEIQSPLKIKKKQFQKQKLVIKGLQPEDDKIYFVTVKQSQIQNQLAALVHMYEIRMQEKQLEFEKVKTINKEDLIEFVQAGELQELSREWLRDLEISMPSGVEQDEYIKFVNTNQQYFDKIEEFALIVNDWVDTITQEIQELTEQKNQQQFDFEFDDQEQINNGDNQLYAQMQELKNKINQEIEDNQGGGDPKFLDEKSYDHLFDNEPENVSDQNMPTEAFILKEQLEANTFDSIQQQINESYYKEESSEPEPDQYNYQAYEQDQYIQLRIKQEIDQEIQNAEYDEEIEPQYDDREQYAMQSGQEHEIYDEEGWRV